MQTDVKVLSHVFSGARGEEYCATIYQMTPKESFDKLLQSIFTSRL